MQRVARFVRADAAEKRQTNQGQVSNQVESFVTPEFVGITERPVQDAIVGKNDGVVERTASDQSHGAKRLNVPFKAKRAGLSQQRAERIRPHRHFNLLAADQRVGKVHVTLDVKFVGRIDADAAVGLDDYKDVVESVGIDGRQKMFGG